MHDDTELLAQFEEITQRLSSPLANGPSGELTPFGAMVCRDLETWADSFDWRVVPQTVLSRIYDKMLERPLPRPN